MTLFFLHSIGFTNMIIYVRPRYVKFRRENPNVGILSSIWHTLARSRPNGRRDGNTRGRTSSGTRSTSLLSSWWRSLREAKAAKKAAKEDAKAAKKTAKAEAKATEEEGSIPADGKDV